eukprot:5764723-Pleurochrysis_carterae.AAC.1
MYFRRVAAPLGSPPTAGADAHGARTPSTTATTAPLAAGAEPTGGKEKGEKARVRMHVDTASGKIFVVGKAAFSVVAVRKLCGSGACARGIIAAALGNVRAEDTCRSATHSAADHAMPKG